MIKDKKYATVFADEGVDYRKIADIMQKKGYKMNHSSARNYVLRIMKKILKELSHNWKINLSEKQANRISKSSNFQEGVFDILRLNFEQKRQ